LDFITKSGLCWDIILEIAKYLTLNDAVQVFSNNILFLLRRNKTKVHLSYSSDRFINMILRTIDPKQIVSLCLNLVRLHSAILPSLFNFTNVISIILLDCERMEQIKECESCFPNLMSTSLWFNDNINFNIFSQKLNQLRNPIKRFEIRCAKIYCTHSLIDSSNKSCKKNLTIEYFILDVSHSVLSSMYTYVQHDESCFFTTIIDLIQYMFNIRYIRLIINKYNLNQFLYFGQWVRLINECHYLKKITIQIMGNIQQDQQLIEELRKIQNYLQIIRESIKFKVIFI